MADLSLYKNRKGLSDYMDANKLQNFEVEQLQQKTLANKQALELKKQAALSGSDLPADIQFAKRRMDLYKIFSNEKEDPQARHLAAREFNELGYKAKTFDIQRGMSSVDESLYPMADLNNFQIAPPNATQPGQFDNLDDALNQVDGLGAGGQPFQPVTPQQMQQPLPDINGGAKPPALPTGQPQGSRIIPTYLNDAATIAANEAAAKEAAKLGEQLKTEPLIEERKQASGSRGKYNEEGRQQLYVKQRAIQAMDLQNDFINNKANQVAAGLQNLMNSGFTGKALSTIPGREAYALAEDIKTIIADSGLNSLIEAKEKGATFGALQEKEMDLLIALKGSLDLGLPADKLLRNLTDFMNQRTLVHQLSKENYLQDYQRFGGAEEQYLPAPEQVKPQGGGYVKIINPQTGERTQVKEEYLQDAIAEGFKKL